MRFPRTTKWVAFTALFILVPPRSGWTDDTTATPAASHKSHKRHHRNKNKSSDGVTHTNTVTPAAAPGSDSGKSNLNSAVSGMGDSLGPNNPGTPNMGSPDHIPGTTGTSGQ
jgi:hypothetical protein